MVEEECPVTLETGRPVTALNKTKSGTSMEKAPMVYATVGPKHQNSEDATIGPIPLAKAPKDLKIPRAVPLSFILGTRDVAIEVRVGPQTADPIQEIIN